MPAKILPFARPGILLPVMLAADATPAITHAGLAKLYRLWCGWVGPDGLPCRSEIKPETLRPWLGNLAIAEIERNPFRIRYRLVGTGLTDLAGCELTGRYVDELYSRDVRREVIDSYRGVVQERRPHYRHARFWLMFKSIGYHRLILPFSSDGKAVDICLVALYPDRPDITRAADWQGNIARAQIAAWFGHPSSAKVLDDQKEGDVRKGPTL